MAGSRRPGPGIEPPADIDPRDLAPEVRSQLRTLSKVAADGVARHLVAAGRLVDEDPAAALQHARAARALGARVAVVREAVGETAYAAGEWAEALAELRTARRMTGDDSALPMIADAERALGRADRALRIAQSDEAQALPPAERAEMRIVEAGARKDLGQIDAALLTLQDAGLDRRAEQPWSARVWYAYADLLLEAGRGDEARDWFAAAAGADQDGVTDADERLLELDGIEILDEDEELADGEGSDGELTDDEDDLSDDEGDATDGGAADGEGAGALTDGEGGLADGGGSDGELGADALADGEDELAGDGGVDGEPAADDLADGEDELVGDGDVDGGLAAGDLADGEDGALADGGGLAGGVDDLTGDGDRTGDGVSGLGSGGGGSVEAAEDGGADDLGGGGIAEDDVPDAGRVGPADRVDAETDSGTDSEDVAAESAGGAAVTADAAPGPEAGEDAVDAASGAAAGGAAGAEDAAGDGSEVDARTGGVAPVAFSDGEQGR